MSVTINGTTGVSLVQDGVLTDANMPAGSVLQVVSTNKIDTFSSTAATTWTDITGLSVTITPTSATSKILVIQNAVLSVSALVIVVSRMLRDSTVINESTVGSVNGVSALDAEAYSVATRGVTNQVSFFLDSPASTSALTYKVQFYVNGAATTYLNRRAHNNGVGCTSSITVMEIAA